MKITSPPLERKMEFHRLRAEGKFPGGLEGWKLYEEWCSTRPPKPPPKFLRTTPTEPVRTPHTDPARSVCEPEEETPPTAREELGF